MVKVKSSRHLCRALLYLIWQCNSTLQFPIQILGLPRNPNRNEHSGLRESRRWSVPSSEYTCRFIPTGVPAAGEDARREDDYSDAWVGKIKYSSVTIRALAFSVFPNDLQRAIIRTKENNVTINAI